MKSYTKFIALLAFLFAAKPLVAQINPLDAQFFQNPYIANPALAGNKAGARLALLYRSQWSTIPGLPSTRNLSFDGRAGKKIGLGLNVYNENSGNLSNTKVQGSYAFHAPVGKNGEELHFGLNLNLLKGNYDIEGAIGDPNDQNLLQYNDRKTAFDADFGLAYTGKRLNFDLVFYGLKSRFNKDQAYEADFNTLYLATGYSFPLKSWNLNAKIAYRGVKNYTDIMDYGFELRSSSDEFGFTGIYHDNKSTTLGLSYNHQKKFEITGFYNTVRPADNYANGTFELALKLNMGAARK